MGPTELKIWDKCVAEFSPVHLQVINESSNHKVPKGSETHFKVIVVSDQFNGVTRVQRARRVMDLLRDEMKAGVHALSTKEYTKEEWVARGETVPPSPPCRGGSHLK